MTSDSAGAVMKLPRRVYSRNSEASVSNDCKIQGFVFVSFLFLSSVITFGKKCANSAQRSQSHITFQLRNENLLSSKITHDIEVYLNLFQRKLIETNNIFTIRGK